MLALFTMAVGASAQIQLLYTDFGRNVIDRNKKLFWMDGDSDPCFDIQSYKKGGNKEVFVISEKEDKNHSRQQVYAYRDRVESSQIRCPEVKGKDHIGRQE